MFDVWLPLIGGLVLLIVGGEFLVRGSVNVATHMGVSPLVIGLTLVGFGTSAPELVTSVQAVLAGVPGIAYGNIVGSNIANILLIGGIAALLFPIAVTPGTLKRDGLVMLAVAIAFAGFASLGGPNRLTGAVFLGALVAYVYAAFRQETTLVAPEHGAVYDKSHALQDTDPALSPAKARGTSYLSAILTALLGLVLVVAGGRFLVDGAVSLARGLGVSETIIGLTIVAVGTSMPELVTSVVAGFKRQSDVAFGNIIGSNIYNILGIGGVTALIAPGAVPAQIVRSDNLIMIAVTLLLIGFAWSGQRIARWEGAALLAGYGIYVYTLWP